MNTELKQYIETALWASVDEQPDGNGGPPMDSKYGVDDLAPETLVTMETDLNNFLMTANKEALIYWQRELGDGQIAHDFWLTRNGHGAGFWDRFSNDPGASYGKLLTTEAEAFGTQYLYAGDDGKVYCE